MGSFSVPETLSRVRPSHGVALKRAASVYTAVLCEHGGLLVTSTIRMFSRCGL